MIRVFSRRHDYRSWLISLVLAIALAGCGGGSGGSAERAIPAAGFGGRIYGGGPQNPIASASITLYAAGTAYGSAATSLATTTSNSDGYFVFSTSYTCPSSTTQTYITATGGNPGSGTNSAIGLIVLTGQCGSLSSSTFVVVNELTTVAAQWALSGFASSTGKNIGAPSSNATGLNNAVNLAMTNLVSSSTGTPASFMPTAVQCAGGSPPVNCPTLKLMDTLANIIAACVNSSGPASGACSTLLSDTGSSADTLAAAHYVATHPASNVSALYALQADATAPFLPDLASAPNDFTVGLTYTAGGLDFPEAIAMDASGNAWLTNCLKSCDGATTLPDDVVELSPTGAALSGSGGYTDGNINAPQGIAIDASGNAWVANSGTNTITKLSSGGSGAVGSPFSGGSMNFPAAIAVDGSGNLWVANYSGNSVTELNSSGGVVAGSPFTGGGLNVPSGIAVDGSGNLWLANFNSGANSVTELTSSGAPALGSAFTGGGMNEPIATAVDASGNVWVANSNGNSVTELNSSGGVVAGSPFTGGGLSSPFSLAVDGSGNVWVANNGANSVTELNAAGTAISSSSGFTGGGVTTPKAIAVDGSGNVWMVNGGSSNSVTELIGAATPTGTLVGCLTAAAHTPACKP